MRWIERIPFWGWLLFSVTFCYTLWNPTGYSIYHMLQSVWVSAPVKAIVVILTGIVVTIYVSETMRTMRVWGLLAYGALVASLLWLIGFGWLSWIDWWGQPVVGLGMTIGLRGSQLFRQMTGRVSVSTDGGDAHPHHH